MKIPLFPIIILLSISISQLVSAPSSSWYLDELGTDNYSYTLSEDIGNNEGTAYSTNSLGNTNGKICSALDFRENSTNDYAKLNADALDNLNDFTISVWIQWDSDSSKALLSGANSTERNELLMWFASSSSFNGYIQGSASDITFPSIADQSWHHFVWRREGTQSCVLTDGINRGCQTVSDDQLFIESLILAQEQDSVGGSFDIEQDWEGLVDELLIFREALSDSDVKSIYDYQNSGQNWNGSTRSCQTTAPTLPPTDYDYSDWHFDEKSWDGTTNEIKDAHSSHHGTGYSVESVEGKICTAMDFSKSSTKDYAVLGAGALDGADDFTVSIWHKGVSDNSGQAVLSGANASVDNEFLFWFTNPSKFNGMLKGSHLGSITSSDINTNTWRHLVWRRVGNETSFFIDSVHQGYQSSQNSSSLSITSLILGQDQDSLGGGFSSAQDWEAVLDELLIFRRALSDTEISSIYKNQNDGKNWDGTSRTCPNMPNLSIMKSSIVTKDLINSTQAKRIPGATIRYCFTVDNNGEGSADDVNIKESLTGSNQEKLSYVKSGKTVQDLSETCDCKNISDSSGTIDGNEVNINSTLLEVNKRICAYIEMLIE